MESGDRDRRSARREQGEDRGRGAVREGQRVAHIARGGCFFLAEDGTMRSLTLAAVVASAAFAVMSLQTHMAFAQAAHRDDTGAADWSTYNRNYAGDRYSPLALLTTANVGRLRQVCSYDTKESVSFQTGPLIIDGVMYFTTDTPTHAIHAGS